MKTIHVKKLIEKLEGEAELDFSFNNGIIDDVKIHFGYSRGIENILTGKDPKDALVITPRVCGICNHAHLLASVEALEDLFRNSGVKVDLSPKAKDIREFTLACELIQNHIKWFYLTILPRFESYIGKASGEKYVMKASHLASMMTNALAVFAGQWPHSSYAVPGGVTCDPTHVDVMQAQKRVDEGIRFFEEVLAGIPLESYMSIKSVSSLVRIKGDFGRMIDGLREHEIGRRGMSHDRFIVFGESLDAKVGKSIKTKFAKTDIRYVKEFLQEGTASKGVAYKNKQYEVGPLARGMLAKTPIIKSLHKRYGDSLLSRVFARVHEVALLLVEAKNILNRLDLSQPSAVLEAGVKVPDGSGVGIVEAARGSLIHTTDVRGGKINSYDIITPTQWNLSSGLEEEHGIAIKAMVGSKSIEEATLIFRAFDVCSVCTTQ